MKLICFKTKCENGKKSLLFFCLNEGTIADTDSIMDN